MKQSLIILALIAAAFGCGYYFSPVKIVEKERIVKVEVEKRDVVKVIRRERQPNGAVISETTITDRTTVNTNETAEKSKETVRAQNGDFTVTVLAEPFSALAFDRTTMLVSRRLFGPFSVTGGVHEMDTLLIGLSWTF